MARRDGEGPGDRDPRGTVTHVTDPGTILGAPAYMAPEQARGEPADIRTDIFTLGCVMHEMMTPRSTFGRSSVAETLAAQPAWGEWNALSEGCYLLRTNLHRIDPGTLWKRYIQRTEAEWVFRITKDEPAIRPLWHQKQDRVKAHILVCFVAYVLWKTLAQWIRGAGLGDAPRTLVEEFAKIKSGDVVLNAKHADGREHPIRVRCVTPPDKAQKVLLHRLGLTLPQRLRTLDEIEQM